MVIVMIAPRGFEPRSQDPESRIPCLVFFLTIWPLDDGAMLLFLFVGFKTISTRVVDEQVQKWAKLFTIIPY